MKNVTLIREIINSDNSRVAEYTIQPRTVGSRHLHSKVFEELFCLNGILKLTIADTDEFELQAGDSHLIPAGTLHCISNISD
ncbi:MAG: cupin domain-containing protein, partial [Gammaproteobacteria bacterium]|nr:cupin domain-containing protein [Gammaproteobacteria bacterium]